MEPESSPMMADLLTDAELALALYEKEVAQLGDPNIQQTRPATPFTHGADVLYDNLGEADVKECQVCCEDKHTDLYPQTTPASDCRCLSDVCLVCMQQHIKSQTESKEWREGSLTCPVCNRSLAPHEIEEYADGDTFKTHLSHMIDQAVRDIPGFTRCPNPGCGSGQVHEGGEARPFVTCAACNTRFCFRHGVPTQPQQQQPSSQQHEDMSCDEYDRYLADPLRFRSGHQRQQERAAVERRELEAVARARERMERVLRRRRWPGAGAAAEDDEMRRSRRTREERGREGRARLEERRYEEGRAERRARANDILRRMAEDEQSERLIGVSTKGCPRCSKRIEKDEGCMHMTCPCGYEFCWECTGPWANNSCGNCFGGPAVQFE